jgi:hypothetical protein
VHSLSALSTLRRRYWNFLEIDRASGYAIAGKMWTLAAGLVTTLLIAVFFPLDVQGYYYTFNAVLAALAVAELGLGTVIVSYASHEWAKLALDESGQVTGDADALSRLTSLGRFAFRWYLVGSAIVTVAMTAWGMLFFGGGSPAFPWKAPWIALCVVTGLNFCLVPVLAMLEGCNQVARVYAYRLLQYVACSLAGWIAIYLGAGLWVASIIGAAGLLVIVISVLRRYRRFMRAILLAQPQGGLISWRTEILPMQWRIALSWVAGYLTFWLFTPVLFHYHGPIVAARMGMTWAFVGALISVAAAWVLPKMPTFGMLIAQQKYAELDRIFWRLTVNVLAVVAAGAVAIWLGVLLLDRAHHPLAARLLPPSTTAYLLVATFIVCASLPFSAYLRAHKKEPLMGVSVVGGVLTAIAVVVLGRLYAADGAAIGYLAVTAAVTPFVALIWQRRRVEWHAPAAAR